MTRDVMVKILSAVAAPLCLVALVLAAAGIWVEAIEPWTLLLVLAALVLLMMDIGLDIHRDLTAAGHDENETCEECER